MKHLISFVLLLSLLLGGCMSAPTEAPGPEFSISVKNKTDQVTYENREGSTVIEVQSQTGIGSARFELTSGQMPEKLIIDLYLAGLEEFRFSFGEIIVTASYSSSGDSIGDRQLSIRVVPEQTTPVIPLQQGYFEVEIPKELLQETGNSFEIQWIDFYR